MRSLSRSLFVLLVSLAPIAYADVTGGWSGPYSVSIKCSGGGSVDSQGTSVASLTQSGNSVSGAVSVQNFNAPNEANCSSSGPGTYSFSLSGTLSGSSFSGTLTTPGGSLPIAGTMSDTSIQLSGTSTGGSAATFSWQRADIPPPSVDLSGTWSGTVEGVEMCGSNPQQWTGKASAVVNQSGAVYSGTLTADVKVANCMATSATNTDAISGLVSGANYSITGTDPTLGAFSGGGEVTGDSAIFAFAAGDVTVVLQLTRTSHGSGPSIGSFTATPNTINAGQSSTLSWSTTNAVSVTIDNGVGSQPVSGSVSVAPTATTTYTLTATNGTGTATATTTVTVSNSTPPANVVLSQFPSGMLQAVGQSGATDHYTLVNSGGTPATVTLSQNGNFFTQSPASFTLAAGASRVVTITATSQPAGTYDGASIAGNLTIPIHLLVAAPPQGSVQPQIVGSNRAETVATIGQNQGSGSVTFTNSGSATLVGIAVSDVPWMTPQGGVITIPPGQTVTINYTIDRTKRVDGASPLGGARCTLSLRFLSGSGSGKWALSPADASGATTVSVPLVDVVKPGVAPGTPPPLGNGEVAFFVPGVSSKLNAIGDLLLANRGTTSISDLKMFFGGSGGAQTQVSTLSALAGNAGVSLPGVVKNVFGADGATGALQLRSSQIANVSVATVQVNTTSTTSSYATALPILRSDRGATAGNAVYLAGVAKDAQRRTNLELQEMSGNAATAVTDFLDANGNVVSSRSDSLGAFAFVDLPDVVPAGAVTARVKNTSSGSGVVGAYAVVIDSLTNDAFTVTDLLTNANASTIVAPLFPPANSATVQSIGFTNVTSSPITVTATAVTGANHHRAAPHALAIGGNAAGGATFTVPAGGFASFSANGTGFLKLDAPAGSLRASATYAMPVAGTQNVFGSGVPALSSLLAIANGAGKRFAGVEASSAATVLRGTPATYRSNLVLLETAGQNATARVTLRFSFLASSLTSATATVSKDFDVPANSAITITDVARSVIGIERDSLGDLHNVQVDVSVVGGSGKVVPLIESIDNGSGDVTVRND